MSDLLTIMIIVTLAVIMWFVTRRAPRTIRLVILGVGLIATPTWAIIGRDPTIWTLFIACVAGVINEILNRPSS